MDPKPGYKTTEFWLTLIGLLGPAFLPGISPDTWLAVAGGLVAIYTAARAHTKRPPTPIVPPTITRS